eukprot:jgi/Hompol1/4860/HPOL_003963-RA
MSHSSETVGLYRQFLRAYYRWPKQQDRSLNFRALLLDKVRTEFRKPAKPESFTYGVNQLRALNQLLDGAFEAQYPLSDSGPIRSHMPSQRTYLLLDSPAQEVLSAKNDRANTWSFLAAYLSARKSARQGK